MLTVTQLGVHFGDRTLFEGLNLFIGKRERIGLDAMVLENPH
jgi:ATPase subunit of ABC transporter with duplicated ATPase domains